MYTSNDDGALYDAVYTHIVMFGISIALEYCCSDTPNWASVAANSVLSSALSGTLLFTN